MILIKKGTPLWAIERLLSHDNSDQNEFKRTAWHEIFKVGLDKFEQQSMSRMALKIFLANKVSFKFLKFFKTLGI